MNIVKQLMATHGLRQIDIAESVGVSRPTVSDWVRNRKDPTGENLRNLSELFSVDPLVILGALSPEAQRVPHDDSPKTMEAKILSTCIDKMPAADRERALAMIKLTFPQYSDFFNEAENSSNV